MTDDSAAIARITENMTRNTRCREEELRRMCERQDIFDIATQLTDELIGNLSYLANFEACVDGHGNRHPVNEVWQQLELFITERFKAITGKEYVPVVVRNRNFRDREKKEESAT